MLRSRCVLVGAADEDLVGLAEDAQGLVDAAKFGLGALALGDLGLQGEVGLGQFAGPLRDTDLQLIVGPAQPLLALAERLLRQPPLGAILRLAQGAPDRRHEPLEPLLEDVVDRAGLEGLDRLLLADGAGDEQERDLRADLPGDLQGRHAVERGQRVVRQDQIRPRAVQGPAANALLGVHQADLAGQAALGQPGRDQLGIQGVVLQVEDPQDPVRRRTSSGKSRLCRHEHRHHYNTLGRSGHDCRHCVVPGGG